MRVKILYGDVGGMWLPTASEATGDVRLLGPHTMVSRDVKYDFSELVAAGSTAPTSFWKPMPDETLRQRVIRLRRSNSFVKNDDWIWNWAKASSFARF